MKKFMYCIWISLLSSAGLGLLAGAYSLFYYNKYIENGLNHLAFMQFHEVFNWVAIPVIILGILLSYLIISWEQIRRQTRKFILLLCLSSALILIFIIAVLKWKQIDIPFFGLDKPTLLFKMPVILLSLLIFTGAVRLTRHIRWPDGRFMFVIAACIVLGTNAIAISTKIMRQKSASRKPNILLISIDTMRANHLSCYGYERKTSPFIDSFAAEAIRFEKTVVPMSTTLPSHSSMLTSLNPKTHGVKMNGMPLNPEIVTLAELLKNEGYQTAGIVGSVVLKHEMGLSRGFQFYDDAIKEKNTRLAEAVRRNGENWLQQHKDAGFFMFLHFWDPHAPYSPPDTFATMFNSTPSQLDEIYKPTRENHKHLRGRHPDFDEQKLSSYIQKEIDLYDGEVRYTDQEIGKLFEFMKTMDCWDETLVIITGDHGESLGERGCWGHGLFYEEQILVPLLIKLPGKQISQGVISETVRLIDVMPTVLDLLEIQTAKKFEGESLVAYFDSEDPRHSRTTYLERRDYPQKMRLESPGEFGRGKEYAIRTDDWKFIFKEKEESELFNLKLDPLEQQNLIESKLMIEKDLRSVLLGWLGNATSGDRFDVDKLDSKTVEQLKSLGYLR